MINNINDQLIAKPGTELSCKPAGFSPETKWLISNFCQTPGYVFRLGVDFVLPLSQEQQQQQQEEEPLTKIYQKG